MKKAIISVIIVLLVVCSIHVASNFNISNADMQIKLAIYPAGTTSESYCLTLYDNNKLIVEKGVRTTTDDITHEPFITKVEKRRGKMLSDSEVSEIISLADEAIQSDYNMDYWDDSWHVQVIYKDKTIMHDCWHDVPPELEILMNKFVEISPIEIDMHGWA